MSGLPQEDQNFSGEVLCVVPGDGEDLMKDLNDMHKDLNDMHKVH